MLVALRAMFRAALPAAVCGFVLREVFEFSTRQSVGIACVLWFLIFSIQSRVLSDDFKPFALHVDFYLAVLFADLGLIESPADLTQAQAEALAQERFQIYAICPGLFATDIEDWPYTRKLEIRRIFEQLSVPATPNSNPYAHRFPEIRFEQWRDWFVLKAVVPEDWERELRTRFPGVEVKPEYGEYDKIGVSVNLAAFPSRYFQHVMEGYEPVSSLKPYSIWKWRDKQFLKSLKASGWERGVDSPEYIKHKYISVGFHPEF